MAAPLEVKPTKMAGIDFYCPSGPMARLSWHAFCAGLGWAGNPKTHQVRAICFFSCPACGKQHKITFPDNTQG